MLVGGLDGDIRAKLTQKRGQIKEVMSFIGLGDRDRQFCINVT